MTSHIYILLSIIQIFIQKGWNSKRKGGGGILCREWDDRHRGSSDFFEMGKTGKEHPVVIALLIWAMGNQSIIYYIVIWKKRGIIKVLFEGNNVSLIAKRFLSVISAIDPWEYLSAHCSHVFHGDCDCRRHFSMTCPYYSYGIRILIHSRPDSSSKRNRGSFLSVPCDRSLDYRPLVVRDFDLLPVHFHRHPKQRSIHHCSDWG